MSVGSRISTRTNSRSFCWPYERFPAYSSRSPSSFTKRNSRSARSRAAASRSRVTTRRFSRADSSGKTRITEGPADPLLRDLPGPEPVDPLAAEHHAPLVPALHARDAVEERRLARAVGTDQAVDPAGLEPERNAVHGGDAAEALPETVDVEHGRRHQMVRGRWYLTWRMQSTPRGMSNTTATMSAPKRSGWT